MASTRQTKKTTTEAPQHMGEGAVTDIVKQTVREALREQARDLEKHLTSIHDRLVALEADK